VVRNPWAAPLLLAVFASTPCVAQSRADRASDPAAPLPEFEVASIKPTDMTTGNIIVSAFVRPGGRVQILGEELRSLIRIAFHLSYQPITGGADWTGGTRYDIEALPPRDLPIEDLRFSAASIADERLRQMLQSLLISRFHLKLHRETTTGTVYLLKRSAGPPAFHPANMNSAPSGFVEPVHYFIQRRQWVLTAATMQNLVQYASGLTSVPVFDRTGLSGEFDYQQSRPDVELADRDSDFHSALTSSFWNFLHEVHLKLERAKGPIETFVIDGAEKPQPN
jgi:uncharacterized protein (TIGR03435 family)